MDKKRIPINKSQIENEDIFRSVFYTSPDSVSLTRLEDGMIIDVNEGFTTITGYSREESIGKTSVDLNIWRDVKERERVTNELVNNGSVNNIEADFLKKDGKVLNSLISAKIIKLNGENFIISIVRDMTDRKATEKALAKRLEFEQLISKISSAFAGVSSRKKIDTIIYKALASIGIFSGSDRAYVFLFHDDNKVADNTHEWCNDNIQPEIESLQNISIDKELPWFSKQIREQEYFYVPDVLSLPPQAQLEQKLFYDQDIKSLVVVPMKIGDQLIGFLGFDAVRAPKKWNEDDLLLLRFIGETFTSVIVRNRAEEALLESKEQYRALFEYSPIDTVIVDKESKILMYNFAKKNSGGRLPRIGSVMYRDYAQRHKLNMFEELTDCITSGKQKEFTDIKYNDKFLNIRISPFSGGAIITSIDTSESKKLQSQLQQSQKMEGIGTLAGGIAHDFNNILSPIMMHAEMAMEDLNPDDPLHLSMKEIYKASIRARDLVKQILTFAHKKPENKIVLRATSIVKEAIKFLRSTIPTTIDIQCIDKAEHDTIFANPTQLNQIVMNLCTNAAHAMGKNGGLLEIILENEGISVSSANKFGNLNPGSYLKLSVRDTGMGIPHDIIERIFEPYYTTKSSGDGTGLGLATVHGIVQNYGGNITVESKVDQGTTFHVYIPLIDKKETPETDEHKLEIQKGTEQILIVDDEKAAMNAMHQMLKKIGYKVTARTSSIEALETFRNNPETFDLIITDMTMPNMTGEVLAKEVMVIKPGIPVILCTGFSGKIDEKKAKAMGISAFVMKPIVMSKMAKTIREVLDKK